MATETNLTTAGSQITIGGAVFLDSANIGSGTGNYNTFLAVKDNDGNELGFNTDDAPPIDASNPNLDQAKTHTVLLATVPVTIVNGVAYYEFRVDLNENNSNPDGQISLDKFQIFTSSNGGIESKAVLDAQTLVYDMDAAASGGDRTLLLSEVSTGSGTDDYAVLVPVANFAGDPATTFMYLYVEMGFKGGDFQGQGGFEEWNLQTAGSLTGTKFLDSDDDGVKDAGEGGMANVTIFIDTNKDGILDAGERSTVTDLNGNYSFFGVALGTYQIDEVIPVGHHQTTGAFETATVSTLGQVVTVDPIGNAPDFVPNPSLNIVKDVSSVSDGPDAFPGAVVNGAGDVINYAITVANTGNVTLTGVTVTDPYANAGSIVRGADVVGDNDGLLEVGETWGYTAAHTVTQAEIDSNGGGNGALENIATADSDQTGPDTDDATVPVVFIPALNIVKDVSGVTGGTADSAGDVISYAITVQNTGNVTLTGVTVTDPYADLGSITLVADAASADGELDVGETWHYTAAHTVLQSEIDSNGGGNGALENIATADSTQTGPDTDDATVPVVYNPALNIVKDVSSVTDGPDAFQGAVANGAGDVVNYAIAVQNTGNVTLTGVTVTDPFADLGSITLVADAASADGELDVGETWHYTAAHTVTQAEIDTKGGGDGSLENIATADSTQTGPDTDDATVPVVYDPSLNIVKVVSGVLGGPGGNVVDSAGDKIFYLITVENTGNVTLTQLVEADPYADALSIVRLADVVGDGDNLLEVGEKWAFAAVHTVTQSEIDSNGGGNGVLENVATAKAQETSQDEDDADVQVVTTPSLNIVKDVSGVTGGTADSAGDVISYAISVENTGNVTLTGVTVTDPYADLGSITLVADAASADGELDVGETWHYTAAHTVLQSEIDSNGGGNGQLENTATADSTQTGPDTDDATVPVVYDPALNIVKDVSGVTGGTADSAGDVISYAISVENTGNVTLTGVTVTDPYADLGSITLVADAASADGELDVGETWHYTAAHTVLQSEIDSNGGGNGQLENTATADSTQTGPDTDDATVPVVYDPALNIVKDVSGVTGGTADSAGDVISYAISVENTGNVTLTGVTVTDPYADLGSITLVADAASADGELDVGETWHYTAAHTVLQSEIDSNGGGNGQLENTATADSTQTGPDTDDATVPVVYDPALNITKDVSSVTDGPDAFQGAVVNGAGDVINYAIRVQNTGNVTLTGVAVTDPYANAGSIVRGLDVLGDNDALLEVGETWSYTAAHTVLQSEIDSNGGGDGLLENTATADSNETGPDTDDASVPVVFDPDISIDKTATIADGHADQAGDIINYTVVVQNTGNVTLNNVEVTDSFEGALDVILTNSNSFNGVLHTGNTFNDPNGNGALDVGESWTYTYQHVVTQNELITHGVDGDDSLDNTATVTTTAPDLGPLEDSASIPILLGPGVRTPGFWSQTNWKKFWDGTENNEPSQAGTNGFADGEITTAVVNSLGDHRVDSNGDHAITAADTASGGKITKGLLIGDFDLNGIENGGEHAFFISTDDALTLLNASQKQSQNAEYQEGRALVATWLNYLAGNPVTAGDPTDVDAKDAIQWAVDWMLKTTQQTDGSISLADMNSHAVAASSAAWTVGIDGPDGGTTPTAYASIPQYDATLDIPGGAQILGVLDEYNNHGTVYGTVIATA